VGDPKIFQNACGGIRAIQTNNLSIQVVPVLLCRLHLNKLNDKGPRQQSIQKDSDEGKIIVGASRVHRVDNSANKRGRIRRFIRKSFHLSQQYFSMHPIRSDENTVPGF
jgi:hypothetical protein